MENTNNKNEIGLYLSYDNGEEIPIGINDETKSLTIREFIEWIIDNLNNPVDEEGNDITIPDEEKIKELDRNDNPIEFYLTKEEDGEVKFLEEETQNGEITHVSDYNFKEGDHIKLQSRLIPG